MIKPRSHIFLDCETIQDRLKEYLKPILGVVDLSVPLAKFNRPGGGIEKVCSRFPGLNVFYLQRTSLYAEDGFCSEIWQFGEDFTANDAAEFLQDLDNRRKNW